MQNNFETEVDMLLIRGLLEKCEKITDPFLEIKEEEFPEEIDG